jgi:glycosyltransferase involved in cell wall biosynthesis
MRIALITDGIAPYVIGGMQKHSFYLAKYFAKNGIYVDLYHFNQSNININVLECFSELEKQFITSIIIDFPQSIHFPGHYIYNSYKHSCLIFEHIKSKLNTYDFIYTKGFTGWKLINEKQFGNIKCCPIGVNFHGYEMFQKATETKAKLQQFLLKSFVKKISIQADCVFSYGGKITPIIESLGVNKNNIIEITSGIDNDDLRSIQINENKGIRRFVFLGRAERRKGIVELNNAINHLAKKNYQFTFEFIGPIPEHLKLNLPNITYHGEIRQSEKIQSILEKQDVLVCPSWSEGFPNVILEAMASGLAIIATDVGAVSEMVSSNNGWLIEAFNQTQLEESLQHAINDKYLMDKKKYSLELLSLKFNWDFIIQKNIEHIKNTLKTNP